MEQQRIKELLEEAAISADWKRTNAIQIELGSAVYDEAEVGGVLVALFNELYMSAIRHRPDILPALLPVFAVLCGGRGNDMIGEIDWSLIEDGKS